MPLSYREHGTGSSVWDAAVVLLKAIEARVALEPTWLDNATVIELGAG